MRSDLAPLIAGVGMTPFGRHHDRNVADLAVGAARDALSDAGLTIEEVDAIWFANAGQGALEGQHMIRGQLALRPLGLAGKPLVNVENACAGGSTALWGAARQIAAGDADVVLVVGADKLVVPDKVQSLQLFEAGLSVAGRDEQLRMLEALAPLPEPFAGARSIFMDIYAAVARHHMRLFGSTVEQLAAVAAKNQRHAVHNPRAQYRSTMSVAEILAARTIVPPLTLPMCAPVSDGAAAAVLVSSARARQLPTLRRAVSLAGIALRTGTDRPADDYDNHIGRRTALAAYEQAGIAAEDVDVAEVHDATAIAEVIQVENLGLAPRGAGGWAAATGETSLGGRCPVNPSGGLEAKGHPIGATGLGQIYELVQQLRGECGARQVENARIAVAENGGGFLGIEEAVCVVTVLKALNG